MNLENLPNSWSRKISKKKPVVCNVKPKKGSIMLVSLALNCSAHNFSITPFFEVSYVYQSQRHSMYSYNHHINFGPNKKRITCWSSTAKQTNSMGITECLLRKIDRITPWEERSALFSYCWGRQSLNPSSNDAPSTALHHKMNSHWNSILFSY